MKWTKHMGQSLNKQSRQPRAFEKTHNLERCLGRQEIPECDLPSKLHPSLIPMRVKIQEESNRKGDKRQEGPGDQEAQPCS